jgi:hypothetical protein
MRECTEGASGGQREEHNHGKEHRARRMVQPSPSAEEGEAPRMRPTHCTRAPTRGATAEAVHSHPLDAMRMLQALACRYADTLLVHSPSVSPCAPLQREGEHEEEGGDLRRRPHSQHVRAREERYTASCVCQMRCEEDGSCVCRMHRRVRVLTDARRRACGALALAPAVRSRRRVSSSVTTARSDRRTRFSSTPTSSTSRSRTSSTYSR